MTVNLSAFCGAGWQLFTDNGTPLSGGKIYTYDAGTTTLKQTFTSSSGATPNANPIILDSAGRVSNEVWLEAGSSYKFIVKTSGDSVVFTKDNVPGIASSFELNEVHNELTAFQADLASGTGAELIGYGNETVSDVLARLGGSTDPVVIVIAGQSNAVGVNNGGANPHNLLVNTWDSNNSEWVSGGQYTAEPWLQTAPVGNGGNNNFALGAAHYIAEKTGRSVYIVFDALSGQPISEWVPSTQPRYLALKNKIQNALNSPELVAAGKTSIDFLIWAQGEENGAGTNALTFNEYISQINTLNTQFKSESWFDSQFTPIYIMGMSPLHDRYQISYALQYFSNKSNGQWRYLSTRSLRTEYQATGAGDYTHWLGTSLFEGGYNIIGPAFLNNERYSQEADGTLFFERGSGTASMGSSTVIASFNTLVNWPSRIGGVTLNETFSGNGVTTAFVLDYRGTTISTVAVDGVEKSTPADYSISTASDGRKTITFVVAPPATAANNIVITYGAAVNAIGATNSFGWGRACYPDGNYTFAGGYVCASSNLCNYSIGWGREIYLGDTGDYGAAFGFTNVLNGQYGFVSGRGNTIADDGCNAMGTFTRYTTTQTDPLTLQIGIGTSTSARKNGLAVRKSGTVEMDNLSTFANNAAAIAGGLIVGQIYKVATGELRIVV